MSSNPFNQALDWALQGKYARVRENDITYEGWIDKIHHSRGSLIMHDCTIIETGEGVGSVFIRTPDSIIVLKPKKRIEWREVDELEPYPHYTGSYQPRDAMMRAAYRNQFTGSFPVVRENGTIINGHKRIRACKAVGLEKHPVEVVDVTDAQAEELFKLAHRSQTTDNNGEDLERELDPSEDPDANPSVEEMMSNSKVGDDG